MRLLIGDLSTTGSPASDATDVTDQELAELYAPPTHPWLRVNMVSTVDGSATGSSGLTGSINNAADHRVFHLLRRLADVIIVGAGTARSEGYGPVATPIVVVSRQASVPETLRGAAAGQVRMATTAHAQHLDEARDLLGAEHVLVLGTHRVDLPQLKDSLAGAGLRHQLCEGGPHLLRDLLAEGVADELDATFVPRLVAGDHPRITEGPPVDVAMRLASLLEEDGTLLGRWLTAR